MGSEHNIHDWELSKENAMPLKRGRDPKKLQKTFGESQSFSGQQRLKQRENEFELEIQNYRGDDPMKPWLSYIKWTQDNYPAGNTEKTLSLLERCTREFKDDPRYRNHDKYLKVWIGYADLLPNPSTVFKFLRCHHMFDGLALFYVATAWAAERRGDFPLADKAYTKGIECEAKPLELLQKRHREFQRRMSRQWLNQAAKQQALSQESRAVNGPRSSPARRFGAIDPSQAAAGARRQAPRGQNLQRLTGGIISPEHSRNSNKPPSPPANSFAVFIEDVAREAPDSWGASTTGREGWKELAPQRASSKENDGQVTGWTQGGLRQHGHEARARGQHAPPSLNEHGNSTFGRTTFDVYVEEEDAENINSSNISDHKQGEVKLRERSSKSDEQSKIAGKQELVQELYKKPMLNFKKEKTAKELQEPASRAVLQPAIESVAKPPSIPQAPVATVRNVAPEEPTPVVGRRLAFSPADTPAVRRPVFTSRQESVTSALEQADDEDMTINTKMALGDVLGMFASPGSHGSSPSSVMSMSPLGNRGKSDKPAPFAIFNDGAGTQKQTATPGFRIAVDEDMASPMESSRVEENEENHSPDPQEQQRQEQRIARQLAECSEQGILKPLKHVEQDASASPAMFNSRPRARRSSTSGRSISSVEDILQDEVKQFSIKEDLFSDKNRKTKRSDSDGQSVHRVPKSGSQPAGSNPKFLSKDLDDFDDDLNRTFDFKSLEAMLIDSDDESLSGIGTVENSTAPSSKPFAIFTD